MCKFGEGIPALSLFYFPGTATVFKRIAGFKSSARDNYHFLHEKSYHTACSGR